jgi:hypothetical protein
VRRLIAVRRVGALVALAAAIVLAACSDDATVTPSADASTASTSPSTASTSPSTVPTPDDFANASFPDPTTVDNRWFPLVPGSQMTWKGHALDGKDKLQRRVVFTVTDLTKEIDGVTSVVIWELDYTDGELEEAELAFFAQDADGNVWHMGEFPEEYEDGDIVKHPLWIAGFDGALPGVHMPAQPALDTPSYAQGLGPAVGWDDRGDTYALGQQTCTDVDCYDDVLVIREFSRDEPGAYQLKYYAPGVGNVRVGWGGPNEEEHEVLVLTSLSQLDAVGLGEARAKALEQEARGYEESSAVYGKTTPAAQA